MRNKKAISHVEVIVSFIIFISFVIFLLVMLNPLKVSKSNTNNIDLTETKIIENISTAFTAVSLKVNLEANPADGSNACFSIDKPENIKGNIAGKDRNNNKINAEIENNKIELLKLIDFQRLYFSDELAISENVLDSCDETYTDYILGVSKTYGVVSYSKLIEFNRSYNEDYQKLKEEQLGLNNDFNFALNKYSVEFRGERYKPSGINIIARDIPITILNSSGDLSPAVLNIQTW